MHAFGLLYQSCEVKEQDLYLHIAMEFAIILVFVVAIVSVRTSADPNSTDVQNVLNFLQSRVDRRLRPVVNQSRPIKARLTFHILTITDFDVVEQKLSCTGWMDILWDDEFMKWKWSDYNGVRHVFPDPNSHWMPVIGVSNSYEEMRPLGHSVIITKVYWNGTVQWYPAVSFVTSCKVDISKYPYDTQICLIEIVPWGRSADEITLEVDKGVLLQNYHENGEWELIEANMDAVIVWNGWMKKSFANIKIVIRRRPAFYALNVILPVLLLSLLNILVFVLPAECGERVSYAITVLLALAVFFSFISDTMPKTAENVSLLSVYLTVMLVVSTCSVAGSIFNLILFHRDNVRPVPRWLARLSGRRHSKASAVTPEKEARVYDIRDPENKHGQKVTWQDVARYLDQIFFAVSMLVILPTTGLLMSMIFIF